MSENTVDGTGQDSIDREFKTILEYKIRIYENLADDALKILSVQLFILPASLSLVSLIIDLLPSDSEDGVNQLASLLNSNERGQLIIAVAGLCIAVLGAVSSYHYSRWKATQLPLLLLEQNEVRERQPPAVSRFIVWAVDEDKVSKLRSISEPTAPEEKLADEYIKGNPTSALIRGTLSISLIVTIGALSFLLVKLSEGLIGSGYYILLGVVVVTILPYVFTTATAYTILESFTGSLVVILSLISEVSIRGPIEATKAFVRITADNPKRSCVLFILVYISGFTVGVFNLALAPIWIFAGVYGTLIGIYSLLQ